MELTYRRYCRAAAVVFLLVVLYTVPTKYLQGRLGHDWAHSVLHVGTAVLAAYAGWRARSPTPARLFTWAVGVIYVALAWYGLLRPGLFLGTRFAIPLGVAENVFHLLVSVPALAIMALHLSRARLRPGPSRARP
jgi:uncharacterized membrane protein YfcA